MKKILKCIRRAFVMFIVYLVYLWGCIWYDKKYLVGKYFDKNYFSKGWQWILQYWFGQKILGKNAHIPWPAPPYAQIAAPKNIVFDSNDMQNFFSVGSYFQGIDGKIVIGKGSFIAPGVGMITANHDIADITLSAKGEDVTLGEACWIGMNSVILPGVVLGPHTVVGAGSVVTKSFSEGYCVIAGSPAIKIKEIITNKEI